MKRILSLLAVLALGVCLLSGCQKKSATYTILEESLSDEEYAIGFRKEDQTLRDEVQRILVELKKDGTAAEIAKKWFDEDTTVIPDTFTPSGATDDSLQKIKDKGVLVMGLDDSFPPMGYNNDSGEIIGFDIDLAKAVCERMGVTLKLQPIVWAQNVSELQSNSVDCLWNGMSINEERREKLCLSEPYMKNRQVVVTLEENNIQSLSDLSGKSLILQKGSTAADALDGKPELKASLKNGEAIEVLDNVLALFELRQGNGEAVLMDEVVAKYYISHLSELEAVASK